MYIYDISLQCIKTLPLFSLLLITPVVKNCPACYRFTAQKFFYLDCVKQCQCRLNMSAELSVMRSHNLSQ